MENSKFRLNKTVFQSLTFQEADKQMREAFNSSPEERIEYFNYLMSVAYQFLGKPWPQMDRNHFELIKRK